MRDVGIYVFGHEKSTPAIFRPIRPSFDLIFSNCWCYECWKIQNTKMNENDSKVARMGLKMEESFSRAQINLFEGLEKQI